MNFYTKHPRRTFLRIGALGALSAIPARIAAASAKGNSLRSPAKQCVLIWLDGGPSHLEMFDPKPEAPEEVRGPIESIQTAITGIRFSSLLPELAQRAQELSVIRSLTSPLGEHNLGTHYMLTGYKPTPALDYPAFGNVFTHLRTGEGKLPENIAIPNHRVGGSKFSPEGFFNLTERPFEVGGDPSKNNFKVQDLDWYPGLDGKRAGRRETFLRQVDEFAQMEMGVQSLDQDPQFEQAFRMLRSQAAKQAFDLNHESAEVRQRYGMRSIGQCCLMARRLIERGVSFVTVNNRGWDTHDRMVERLRDGYAGAKTPVGLIPSLDRAVSALIDDLKRSGKLEETLIVVMGEFGRTPKLNASGGRDHWPRAFSVMMAGGGIPGGVIVGSSDEKGESPRERPVKPAELIATVYEKLGINSDTRLRSPDGRPVPVANNARPIRELL